MSNRLGGKQGTAYLGTNAQQPPNWNFYPHDPTIYTYQNFSLGDLWLNTVTQQAFVLVSLERNTVTNEFNAIWTDFTGTAAGVVESLQAADGTVAFPVNGQIDFPNTVITANTNEFTNILTSVQANNSNNFLINLTPEVKLRSTLNDVFTVKSVTNNNTATQINVFKSKGTIAAPLPVVATTELSDISSYGFDGTNNTIGTSIKSRVPASGIVGANCVEAALVFSTAGSTGGNPPSVLNERLIIDQQGQVLIQAPTIFPSTTLRLEGNPGNNNQGFTLVSSNDIPGGQHDAADFENVSLTAGSSCEVVIQVKNQPITTGGDPTIRFANDPLYDLTVGLDTSANQFSMGNGPALGASNFFVYNRTSQQINYPQQCSFYALVGTNLVNVTGNATGSTPLYHPPFTNVIRNVSNSFTGATGRFSAPIGGMYSFSTELYITGVNNINYSLCQIGFAVNGNGFIQGLVNPWYRTDGTFGYCSVNNSAMFQLNQNDYVEVAFLVYNGALTVGVTAGSGSYFSGQLLS